MPEGTMTWERIEAMVADGTLRQVEVAWPDHQGVVRGKRIPAKTFLGRARGEGFAFCDASLGWDFTGGVADVALTGWGTGYPDFYGFPDPATLRMLPWREGAAIAICDVRYQHADELVPTAPRSVLRSVCDCLAGQGYAARVGVEIEFHLLRPDTLATATAGVQCYSLQKLNELDPAIDHIVDGLDALGILAEGVNMEYGPGQVELNLRHLPPIEAADQAMLFKYAIKRLAREQGLIATCMAKPYNGIAGNSMHLHASLWKDGKPAFAPVGKREMNPLMSAFIGGALGHLPGITLYGAPTVNAYKRFEQGSFAPTTAVWGGDNRTVAVRALVEEPHSSRVELRTGGADANPYWAIASYLAAGLCGIAEGADPGPRSEGNMYGVGPALPTVLIDAIRTARADQAVRAILGENATGDYSLLCECEWNAFIAAVTEWDRERYLHLA